MAMEVMMYWKTVVELAAEMQKTNISKGTRSYLADDVKHLVEVEFAEVGVVEGRGKGWCGCIE